MASVAAPRATHGGLSCPTRSWALAVCATSLLVSHLSTSSQNFKAVASQISLKRPVSSSADDVREQRFGAGYGFIRHSCALVQSGHASQDVVYVEPLIGKKAPDFGGKSVFNRKGKSEYILSESFKGEDPGKKKYVVLLFYPLDTFAAVCPTELKAFNDEYEKFQKLKTDVIAVSTDTVFSQIHWIHNEGSGIHTLKYPVILDGSKEISRAYGVLDSEKGVSRRGLFIIDDAGTIKHATINSFEVGRSVAETLRTLVAVQYTKKHSGQACPEGWNGDDKTVVPLNRNYPTDYTGYSNVTDVEFYSGKLLRSSDQDSESV